MSLTPFEIEIVQSVQSVLVENTIAKELMAEEAIKSSDSFFADDDDSVFELRLFLLAANSPGATAAELSLILGAEKRRTIERHLVDFREMGLFAAWTRVRQGQWKKPGSRYAKDGPLPLQHWLTGDLSNPRFQNLDLETRKGLWRARKFWAGTSDFKAYMMRSMIAKARIISAGGAKLDQLAGKVPELKRLSTHDTKSISHPKLPLEYEAAEYVASRLLFALPEEGLPPEESRRVFPSCPR